MRVTKLNENGSFVFYNKSTQLDTNVVNSITSRGRKITKEMFLQSVSKAQLLTILPQYSSFFEDDIMFSYYKSKFFDFVCYYCVVNAVEYFFINSNDKLQINQMIKFGTITEKSDLSKVSSFVEGYAKEWSGKVAAAYKKTISSATPSDFSNYNNLLKESYITTKGRELIEKGVANHNQIKPTVHFKWSKVLGLASSLNEKAVPKDEALWQKAIAAAKRKFDVYPSRYANWWASDYYKKQGGTFK